MVTGLVTTQTGVTPGQDNQPGQPSHGQGVPPPMAVGKYEACDHIGQRWPGLSGRVLQQAVLDTYRLNPGEVHYTTYFCDDGSRRLLRHKDNDRLQTDTIQKYRDTVLTHGVLQGVRGSVWATIHQWMKMFIRSS